jgi:hypothetical protein
VLTKFWSEKLIARDVFGVGVGGEGIGVRVVCGVDLAGLGCDVLVGCDHSN